MDQIAQILGDIHADLKMKSPPQQIVEEEKSMQPPSTPDISKIQSELYAIKNRLEQLIDYVNSGSYTAAKPSISNEISISLQEPNILEGVFNGEKMIGPDGKEYTVPANYASKSKLVEGDIMKLTIRNDGSFLYKQIGPIHRKRIMGRLEYDQETQKWTVNAEGVYYKILTASVTFYKGTPHDEVIILIPENGISDWGAVENIIPQ